MPEAVSRSRSEAEAEAEPKPKAEAESRSRSRRPKPAFGRTGVSDIREEICPPPRWLAWPRLALRSGKHRAERTHALQPCASRRRAVHERRGVNTSALQRARHERLPSAPRPGERPAATEGSGASGPPPPGLPFQSATPSLARNTSQEEREHVACAYEVSIPARHDVIAAIVVPIIATGSIVNLGGSDAARCQQGGVVLEFGKTGISLIEGQQSSGTLRYRARQRE
jgi:hypothetical protein